MRIRQESKKGGSMRFCKFFIDNDKLSLVLAVMAFVVYFVGQARTDEITVEHYIYGVTDATPYVGNDIKLKYDDGALEGMDPNDIEVPFPPDTLQGGCDIEGVLYATVAKPTNSTTDTQFNFQIFPSDGLDPNNEEKWKFSVTETNGSTAWKNIFFVRYGTSDPTDPDNILDMWDVKYFNNYETPDPDDQDWIISGSFDAAEYGEVYDQTVFQVFNYADLNRDRKVNFLDFGILSSNWQRTGIDKGSDPMAIDDYADMDGTGIVDVNDLSMFVFEWLWDADNPAT